VIPGPTDLLRLPGDAVSGGRRLLAELIAARRLLEELNANLERDFGDLKDQLGELIDAVQGAKRDLDVVKEEIPRIREEVDSLEGAVPGGHGSGPLKRVKDALTPDG